MWTIFMLGSMKKEKIDRASGEEFKPFFSDYISNEAHVFTDIWKGYLPLENEYVDHL
jgi:hypothetical protein